MKITKLYRSDTDKRIANIGCDRCPNCGQDRFTSSFIKSGGGLSSGILVMDRFPVGSNYVDRYECLDCGCKWESDPYRE